MGIAGGVEPTRISSQNWKRGLPSHVKCQVRGVRAPATAAEVKVPDVDLLARRPGLRGMVDRCFESWVSFVGGLNVYFHKQGHTL